MTIDQIKKELQLHWDPDTLELAIRAQFRCEYCDQSFFDSIDSYYLFERDHIIPKGVGPESFDNQAAVCSICNFLKRRWDPSKEIGDNIQRSELIAATREYIKRKRTEAGKRIEAESRLAKQLMDILS